MFYYYEDCPVCGNEIGVVAHKGDIRRCPYCHQLYIVKYENKTRKILEEYQAYLLKQNSKAH
ncbi:hypothetical protein DXB99_01940 [Agathobacter rectalis]|uniref:Uncharacterized protein n=1 Tax=Agathobacter rectalis TaxID=39491 RepID=A0A3E4YKN3_9FIRM|nr:hypothetical protein DXB99_01940 [Agathobacter rectalis]